jgi:hypothetical protein
MTDHDVVDAMLAFGGNFIHHLALAFQTADAINQQRIKTAFADEWRQYDELALLREQAALQQAERDQQQGPLPATSSVTGFDVPARAS